MCGWPPDVSTRCMPATYVLSEIWIATGFRVVNDCKPLWNWPQTDKRPSPRSLMKVGVPLGNSTCYVFKNINFGRIPSHNGLPFANRRQQLRIQISTSKVGLASVPLGTAPQYANEAWFFLHSGLANRKGIVDVGIAPFAISDFVSHGVPLGWGEICPIDVRKRALVNTLQAGRQADIHARTDACTNTRTKIRIWTYTGRWPGKSCARWAFVLPTLSS